MRYYVPGSIIQRAVESVGSQLGDTISNIPDMLRAKEERERRRRLEDEDRIIQSNERVRRNRIQDEELGRTRTIFNQGQEDRTLMEPVRKRVADEGALRTGYKQRVDVLARSLDDPAFTKIREYVLEARNDEDEYNRRVAEVQPQIDLLRKQLADERARQAARVAAASRGPDPVDVRARLYELERARDLRDQGYTPENLDELERQNQAPVLGQIGNALFPGLGALFGNTPADPEVTRSIRDARQSRYFKLPIGVTQSERARMTLQEAQAERQRQPNASVEAQLARLDLRKREQVNRALQQYHEGKVDDRTFHAQLKSLGLTNEEIAGLFEGPPDSP